MKFLRNALTATRHPTIGFDYIQWKIGTMIGRQSIIDSAFGTRLRTPTFADLRATRGFVPRAAEAELIRSLSSNYPLFMVIGANFGVWVTALAAAHPTAHVYCFEPTPNTFAGLSANIALNRLRNVTALQLAVSDSEGVFPFQLTENASNLNRLAPIKSSAADLHRSRFIGARTTEVRSVVLDDFCRDQGIDRIGFLKIDVEGADVCVLRGARDLLRRQAIELMLIEVDPDNLRESGDSLEGLASRIAEEGYAFHFLQTDGSLGPPVDIRLHARSGHSFDIVARPISI
jgi:FkbM family methyltransferase